MQIRWLSSALLSPACAKCWQNCVARPCGPVHPAGFSYSKSAQQLAPDWLHRCSVLRATPGLLTALYALKNAKEKCSWSFDFSLSRWMEFFQMLMSQYFPGTFLFRLTGTKRLHSFGQSCKFSSINGSKELIQNSLASRQYRWGPNRQPLSNVYTLNPVNSKL